MSDVTDSTFVPSQLSDMSPAIGQLAAALAVAQGKITGALKDSKNPFFNSKYADLASCWDACRAQLSENGLSVIQTMEPGDKVHLVSITTDKNDKEVRAEAVIATPVIITMLAHSSGEWIRGRLPITPVKADPQALGSALTYGRRYALAAIVGLAQIDDDANAASRKPEEWSGIDTKKKNQYVKQLGDCFGDPGVKDPDNLGLKQLWDEIRVDHDMARAVWANLQKWQRDILNKLAEQRAA